MAVGRVRGQRLRLGIRVRRVRADRDPGAARRARPGVGAGRGRAGRGRRGRGAARSVDRVPPQAAGDDRHGPGPVHGGDEHPRRVRARLAELRSAGRRLGHRRGGEDNVQRGQRRVPEVPRQARGPARRERAIRIHVVDLHRGRAAARRGRDRAVRARHDGVRRRGQLPALRGRDHLCRDERDAGTAADASRFAAAASRRPA